VASEVGHGSCFRLVFPRPGTATSARVSARTNRSNAAVRYKPHIFSVARPPAAVSPGAASSASDVEAGRSSQPTSMP
jgi:hypothetical protein